MKLILGVVLTIVLSFNILGVPQPYSATAYCLKGKTASGLTVRRGIVAANSLPLGTKVHIEAGNYTGVYLVADRGVKGARVDIWVPTRKEAMTFGRRPVKLTVIK
jgi:3D (Asp-Asp-Asp) domain-containing protein